MNVADHEVTPDTASILRPMPRRQRFAYKGKPPQAPGYYFDHPQPRAPFFRTFLRVMKWTAANIELAFRMFLDLVTGRRSDRQRGLRLRQLFERMGGTAIKVGQQLSVRIDLLPWEVCEELAKLQDNVPPFDVEYAISRFEETTGRRLEDVFESFDPVPIGSASIACVYQALLKNGDKVAVKVRRPGIQRNFATDLKFIDWLTYLPEALALVRRGFFKYLRDELRQMLMEELDFDREARYQRLFRQEARRSKLHWLSAPKVYTEFCSAEVMVTRFASGIWCRELLAAVESGDEKALEYIRSLDISPSTVARRLLYVQFWSSYEGMFFHADPHPSNIVIQQGGKVVFLDFGSCGTTSVPVRHNQQELLDSLARNDVTGMVEAAVHLLEPLPPIDVHAFKRKIEVAYERQVFAVRDKDSQWWERTTMGLWLAMVQVTQEFKLPVNLDVIRQFRSSLLYDTLAFRIHPELKLVRLYLRYKREATERMARGALIKRERIKPREQRHRRVAQMGETIDSLRKAAGDVESTLQGLPVRFTSVVNKGAFVSAIVLRLLLGVWAVVACGIVGVWIWRAAGRQPISETWEVFIKQQVLEQPLVLVVIAVLFLITLRRILLRLNERDSQSGRRPPWSR